MGIRSHTLFFFFLVNAGHLNKELFNTSCKEIDGPMVSNNFTKMLNVAAAS